MMQKERGSKEDINLMASPLIEIYIPLTHLMKTLAKETSFHISRQNLEREGTDKSGRLGGPTISRICLASVG